jgi:hypothetical protein
LSSSFNENLVLTFDAETDLLIYPRRMRERRRLRLRRTQAYKIANNDKPGAMPAKPISQIPGALTTKAQNNLARPTDIRTNLGLR